MEATIPSISPRKRCQPINRQQKEALTEYLQKHPNLKTGKFSAIFTARHARALWVELAKMLNAMEGGAIKDWMQWRKTWQDIRKKAIGNQSHTRKYLCGTGGGPPIKDDELDETIADLVSNVIISGDPHITESESSFKFTEEISGNNVTSDIIPATNDHDYCREGEVQAGTSQGTKKEKPGAETSRKRIVPTKVARLIKSQTLSAELISLNREIVENDKAYKEKKLELLKQRNLQDRQYQNRKIAVWKQYIKQMPKQRKSLGKKKFLF